MKVGIVGYAGSGKSTAFHWLTGAKPDPAKAQMGQTGVAKVPDPRLDLLTARFQRSRFAGYTLRLWPAPMGCNRSHHHRKVALEVVVTGKELQLRLLERR